MDSDSVSEIRSPGDPGDASGLDRDADWALRAFEFVAAILALPGEALQTERVRQLARVEPWAVIEALLTEAAACGLFDTGRGVTVARWAVLAAEGMDGLHPASLKVGVLLSRAWSQLGEAHRCTGHLGRSEEAFRRAAACLALYPDSLETCAFHFTLLSRLRRDQGDTDLAEELLRHADILREALADPRSQQRSYP